MNKPYSDIPHSQLRYIDIGTYRKRKVLQSLHGLVGSVPAKAIKVLAGCSALHHILTIEYALTQLLSREGLPRSKQHRELLCALAFPAVQNDWRQTTKWSVAY